MEALLHQMVVKYAEGGIDLEGVERCIGNLHKQGTAGYHLRQYKMHGTWRATPLGAAVVRDLHDVAEALLGHSKAAAMLPLYRIDDDHPEEIDLLSEAVRRGFPAGVVSLMQDAKKEQDAHSAILNALPEVDFPHWEEVFTQAGLGVGRELCAVPAEVVPRLFLCAADMVAKVENVTHIVNLCPKKVSTQRDGAGYTEVECEDAPTYPIVLHFEAGNTLLTNLLKEGGGNVVVHCYGGINRSTALVVAYLLSSGRSYTQAIKSVLSKRPNVLTNKSFRKQLVQYASQLGRLE